MALSFQILGDIGRDNALLVTVDSGQAVSRLLFDCGEGCLSLVPFGTILEIDHLLFSHQHVDHIAGFDSFFRCTFSRGAKENHIWGPPRTGVILQHRFQGFMWNLFDDEQGTWRVHDLHIDRVETSRFEFTEAFALAHPEGSRPYERTFQNGPGYTVDVLLMDHGIPSAAYVVREIPRVNIDVGKLAQLGLSPGHWLQRVRGPLADKEETVVIGDMTRSVRELQEQLLVETAGDSIAYLTDFLLDERAEDRLANALQGVHTVVCESQYLNADEELARRNHHMTSTQVAKLAKRAGVGKLVLFHFSDRYTIEGWRRILAEAKAIFPNVTFPSHWQVDAE